jgi:hypothetical protein
MGTLLAAAGCQGTTAVGLSVLEIVIWARIADIDG